MEITRAQALEVVAAALAAESGCRPEDFAGDGVHVAELAPTRGDDPRRRRFPRSGHSLSIATMGAAVVVSATSSWMPWLREALREAEPGDLFGPAVLGAASQQASRHSCSLRGPLLYGCASSGDWRGHGAPEGYSVTVGGAELVGSLARADWPNAISARARAQGRAVAAAAVARRGGEVAGVATATADSEELWQVGVDVGARHRGRALGAALVSRVTESALRSGRVPYYGSAADNIASRRLARTVGFVPVWIAAFTVESPAGSPG